VESSRGWRLDKAKQSHKIDIIVALSMAALAAVQNGGEPYYDIYFGDPPEQEDEMLQPPDWVRRKPSGMSIEQYEMLTRPPGIGAAPREYLQADPAAQAAEDCDKRQRLAELKAYWG